MKSHHQNTSQTLVTLEDSVDCISLSSKDIQEINKTAPQEMKEIQAPLEKFIGDFKTKKIAINFFGLANTTLASTNNDYLIIDNINNLEDKTIIETLANHLGTQITSTNIYETLNLFAKAYCQIGKDPAYILLKKNLEKFNEDNNLGLNITVHRHRLRQFSFNVGLNPAESVSIHLGTYTSSYLFKFEDKQNKTLQKKLTTWGNSTYYTCPLNINQELDENSNFQISSIIAPASTVMRYAIEKSDSSFEKFNQVIKAAYKNPRDDAMRQALPMNIPFYKKWQFWVGIASILIGIGLIATGVGPIPGILLSAKAAAVCLAIGITFSIEGTFTTGYVFEKEDKQERIFPIKFNTVPNNKTESAPSTSVSKKNKKNNTPTFPNQENEPFQSDNKNSNAPAASPLFTQTTTQKYSQLVHNDHNDHKPNGP